MNLTEPSRMLNPESYVNTYPMFYPILSYRLFKNKKRLQNTLNLFPNFQKSNNCQQ